MQIIAGDVDSAMRTGPSALRGQGPAALQEARSDDPGAKASRSGKAAPVSQGNTYVQMRDVLGPIRDDAPWRLALVAVMQFAEGLCERQVAEAVRARIDGTYALGLDPGDSCFDYSVLSELRTRLVEGAAEDILLDTLHDGGKAHGYLEARDAYAQHVGVDGMHVLTAIFRPEAQLTLRNLPAIEILRRSGEPNRDRRDPGTRAIIARQKATANHRIATDIVSRRP